MALYTWLTINVGRHPWLLRKLRQASFDMLFIGVESFSSNSLLETAKVQNTTGNMIATLREIQSYGFVIVGDSTSPTLVDVSAGTPIPQVLPGEPFGKAEIFFAHLDKSRSQALFGDHNFVFSGELKHLLGLAKLLSDRKDRES